MTAVIYGLYCPVAKTIRYVGKSNDVQNRFRSHLKGLGRSYRARWIRNLLLQNLRPKLKILFRVPVGGDWQKAERALIAKYRAAGCRLTNLTDGGEGWANMSLSVRRRHKLSSRLANSRPERRAARKAFILAAWQDPDYIERRRVARAAYFATPEAKKKLRAMGRRTAMRRGSKAMSDSAKKGWEGVGAEERKALGVDRSIKQKRSWKRDRAQRVAALHSPKVVAKREAIKASPEVNARWREGLRAAWVVRKARQESRVS